MIERERSRQDGMQLNVGRTRPLAVTARVGQGPHELRARREDTQQLHSQ